MGFVYFLQEAGNTNYVKIGHTSKLEDIPARAIEHRKQACQTGNPRELQLVGYIEHDFADVLENQIHKELWHKRAAENGGQEWFQITPEETKELVIRYGGKDKESIDRLCVGGTGGDRLPNGWDRTYSVRPLRWRQQDGAAGRGEDVSRRRGTFDDPHHQHLFSALRRKHKERGPAVLREERQDHRDGDLGVRDDPAV